MVRELPKAGDSYGPRLGMNDPPGVIEFITRLGSFFAVCGRRENGETGVTLVHPEMPFDNPVPPPWTIEAMPLGGIMWPSLERSIPINIHFWSRERQLVYLKNCLIESGLMRADNEEGANG